MSVSLLTDKVNLFLLRPKKGASVEVISIFAPIILRALEVSLKQRLSVWIPKSSDSFAHGPWTERTAQQVNWK